jgi:signal transduction histidine kinase
MTASTFVLLVIFIAVVIILIKTYFMLEIKMENEKKQELVKVKIEAQQEERARIARDLHDDYGVRLTTLKLYMQAADKDQFYNPELIQQHSLDILDGAIRELRNILFNLSPRTLKEHGLIPALEEMTSYIHKIKFIDFHIDTNALNIELSPLAEFSFYRICQELINNTVKYAQAKNITISFVYYNDEIVFLYEDDGNGFELDEIQKGYGIKNVELHALSMGGEVHVDSKPKRGMNVSIEIPYKNVKPIAV